MLSEARRFAPTPVALAALLLCACEDGGNDGPTGPRPDPFGNQIVVSSALAAHEGQIRTLIEGTITRVRGELPVTGVTIMVEADAARAIPGWAIGGRTRGGITVELSIDPGFPNLSNLLDARLPPLTAHELHHIARTRGPGYGPTLLAAMVSEGLADQFSLELYGGAPPPWTTELHGPELDLWLENATEEFDSTTYDHDAWFFGGTAIPRWAGYAIGHRLVADYQAAHSGESAADLVNTPAEAFRPD